tara:strand:- start:281 stop:652 length:372 start_codon:yes stop_codon:yes gene_type:complete
MHSHVFLSVLPQEEHLRPCPLPELRIVREQQTGLLTILAVAKSNFIFSRWIEPSGEDNPDQDILSPGISVLRSLFTGPPSEKATRFTVSPDENTEMCAWPPLASFGSEVTVPDEEESMWSSLS